MKNRTTILLGSLLIVLGFFSIINALFHINLWTLFFPILLIALGAFLIFRPKISPDGTDIILRFVGETNKSKEWSVSPVEYQSFVSDIKLDFSAAIIPEGETQIRITSFVSDLKVLLPMDAGMKVIAKGFVHDTKVNGHNENHIGAPFEFETQDFPEQMKKIIIESWSFVSEVEIKSYDID